MKKILIVLLSCFMLLNINIPTALADENNVPELVSHNVVLMDAKSKRILYEKNADEVKYPASITKIMTMLLGVENGNFDDIVTMSHYAVYSIESGSSHIALNENEQITLKMLLEASSIASANDAANGIAEYIGKSNEGFTQLMNDRAKSIGCTNTHFVNAHGLHDENHYSTARDMALIMQTAIQNEKYLEITKITNDFVPPTNLQPQKRPLNTNNRVMQKNSPYYIPEVISSKTGYTDQARHSIVSYASKDGKELIVSIMDCESAKGMYEDTKKLLNYGFENYIEKTDINDLLDFPSIHTPFKLHVPSSPIVGLKEPFKNTLMTQSELNHISFTYDYLTEINEVTNKDTVIGTCSLLINDQIIQTSDVVLQVDITSKLNNFLTFVFTVLKWFIIAIILAIISLIIAKKLYIAHRRKKRKKMRELKRRQEARKKYYNDL